MTNNNYVKLYVNFLKKHADVKKPLKVVVDCSNGPAGLVLKELKLPNIELIIINSRVDGRFPAHNPNPLEPHALDDAEKTVKKYRADFGAVFDADADRVFFIDNLGRLMPFHAATYLLSFENDPPYVGDIYVAEVMNHLNIIKVNASKVGTYYIRKTMKKTGASLGAEFSRHYFFKETKNADSGILALIKALNSLSKKPYTAAQFTDLVPEFYYGLFNKKTENPAALMGKIMRNYRKKALRISRLDGFLFDFGNWLLVVRSSNTEPLLRLFVGSKDKKVFQKELKKLKLLS
ncbi:MAG: hypothetical protein V2A55_00425 [Candidatus Jorgensenbacteria bacterium]